MLPSELWRVLHEKSLPPGKEFSANAAQALIDEINKRMHKKIFYLWRGPLSGDLYLSARSDVFLDNVLESALNIACQLDQEVSDATN
jgi:hypothetical protein